MSLLPIAANSGTVRAGSVKAVFACTFTGSFYLASRPALARRSGSEGERAVSAARAMPRR